MRLLQKLPTSEIYMINNIVQSRIINYKNDREARTIPEEDKNFADQMINVCEYRLQAAVLAKYKKLEEIFKNPKFK
ncbi:hypothetical protein [Pareuzebyella sediminis]|uniref:hypothetical protein n=1 Tax=Pareuzebyella sediminis TaxID=2607998 RepID=UPI0011EFD293|nr:hypothetical protein [Pareuzebyella sediminis]